MDLRQRLTTTDISHVAGPHDDPEGPWLAARHVDDEGELATDDEGEMDPLPEAVRDDWTAGGQAMTCRGIQAQWRDKYPKSAATAFRAAKGLLGRGDGVSNATADDRLSEEGELYAART